MQNQNDFLKQNQPTPENKIGAAPSSYSYRPYLLKLICRKFRENQISSANFLMIYISAAVAPIETPSTKAKTINAVASCASTINSQLIQRSRASLYYTPSFQFPYRVKEYSGSYYFPAQKHSLSPLQYKLLLHLH